MHSCEVVHDVFFGTHPGSPEWRGKACLAHETANGNGEERK